MSCLAGLYWPDVLPVGMAGPAAWPAVNGPRGRNELPPPPTRHHHLPERRQGGRGAGSPLRSPAHRHPRHGIPGYSGLPWACGGRVVGSADTSPGLLTELCDRRVPWPTWAPSRRRTWRPCMASEPDVIFIGGRLASSYDALSEIAPVVYLATDPRDRRGGERPQKRCHHRLHVRPGKPAWRS